MPTAFGAVDPQVLAQAAIGRARALGASHADVRIKRIRRATRSLRDGDLEASSDDVTLGLGVRVIHGGAWGFASDILLTVAAAEVVAERAVAAATVSAPLAERAVQLAPEPVHRGEWVSAFKVNPFEVPEAERLGRLRELSSVLSDAPGVDHVTAHLDYSDELTFYADSLGAATQTRRIRMFPTLEAASVSDGFNSMRTCAPPVGRGWEYLADNDGWDFDSEVAQLPGWLRAHAEAPSVAAGRYDLVIDPTNLWLTIHESVAHATELDRALGYEAAYAGTSFATVDQLGKLKYGAEIMNVTGDRVTEHGLATTAWDDEGVAGQTFDIVRGGILVGYQLNRQMAAERGLRSNGCAYADDPGHIPLQRMPNVSLAPDPAGPDVAGLIAQVERGIYVVGDKSWSIDMQRYNFQFTGQRFFQIRDGKLDGQLRDVAYQATTTDFWGSLAALGGPQTYLLAGAFNCGKGQPGQVAPVSHGCPAALFRGVNVLNTVAEGAHR